MPCSVLTCLYLTYDISALVTDVYDHPQVDTTLGKVEGAWRTSVKGRKYAAFEGIPYAQPPIGDLRFKAPEPVEPWLGVWNATKIYACPQSTMDLNIQILSTEDDVVPGNNGLKDQALALKWIQEHIEAFGGNPKSVTLTGFSAGAASVHFHYFSPYSVGLFHRLVCNKFVVLSKIYTVCPKLVSMGISEKL
nr:unnamed protein product [Callosobruchus chinensis]